jgi:DNA-binding GntR family transcriptional regulator
MGDAAQTKRAQIVDEVRRRILAGDLTRGARLPQDELARQFGASITPVREALSQLAAEGLVVAERHRGVRVAGVDLEQVTATYIVRRLTETYAMRRATLRLSRRDLARAREILSGAQPGAHDTTVLRDHNREFHFLCYERCGMPALTERIAAMWQAFPWDLTLHSEGRSEASHAEHLEILAELEAGDPDRVAAATEHHLRNGFASILQQLTGREGPDPFDLNTD